MPMNLIAAGRMFGAIALLLGALGSGLAQEGADYPTRPIELVTHNQPGAVLDVMGRLIADIVEKDKLLDQPIVVVNKPGTGGAASFGYILEKKGDDHTILAMPINNIINLPLTENLPYNYTNFTPIANLTYDASVLFVRADSPYKTIDDLIADAKARPGELNQSVSSTFGAISIMSRQIMRAKGVEWQFVTFKSVPESVLAVLNGTVEIGFAQPTFLREHVRAGTVRLLVTGAPDRFGAEMDAPTIEELGLGEPRVSYRGFFGPPDMPEYAVKKIQEVLKAVLETQRFKDYMAENMMVPAYMDAADFTALMERQNEVSKQDLADAGMLKN